MKRYKFIGIAIFTGLLFGYHLGIIGPTLPFITHALKLDHWQLAHIVSVFMIGLLIGALSTFYVLDHIGRKMGLLFCSFLFIIAPFLGLYSCSFEALLIYRWISGLACGMIAVMGPLVIVENALVDKRGRYVCLFQICISLGVAISFAMGFLERFRMDFGFIFFLAIIPALMGIGFFYRLNHLKKPEASAHFEFKKYYRSYLVAGGLNFFQQACGINAITFFAQTVLLELSPNTLSLSYELSPVFSIFAVLATLFALTKIDVWGRKKLLIIGAIGMSLSMGLLAFDCSNLWSAFLTLLGFVIFFGLSFGPVVYLMTSEVFPDFLRAKGASFAFFINCLTNYLISLIFLPVRHYIGPSSMWIFFGLMSFLALLFIWKRVPETAHQETESIVKKLNHLG